MMSENKQLKSECRTILMSHEEALKYLIDEVKREVGTRRFEELTAFGYAKQVIRNQGVFEGLDLLMQRINKYGSRE